MDIRWLEYDLSMLAIGRAVHAISYYIHMHIRILIPDFSFTNTIEQKFDVNKRTHNDWESVS